MLEKLVTDIYVARPALPQPIASLSARGMESERSSRRAPLKAGPESTEVTKRASVPAAPQRTTVEAPRLGVPPSAVQVRQAALRSGGVTTPQAVGARQPGSKVLSSWRGSSRSVAFDELALNADDETQQVRGVALGEVAFGVLHDDCAASHVGVAGA